MNNFWILSLCLLSAGVSVGSGFITWRGMEGGNTHINCTYEQGFEAFPKYILKGDYLFEILIKTLKVPNQSPVWTYKGRYALYDDTERRVFTVTIDNLNLEDAGTYWCGVESWGLDKLIQVRLTVDRVSGNSVLRISLGTVSLAVLLLVVSLLIVYRWKCNKEQGPVSPSRQKSSKPNTGNTKEATYKNLNPSMANQDTIYQSLNPETANQDTIYQSLNPEIANQDTIYQSLNPETQTANQDTIYQSLNPGLANQDTFSLNPGP
ncbi:CMRF35-like molecule 3 [Coregonus clupeaformis]|uniref:CMRF35-like molecule 3 n=1 Tax=Coregonus clupeaformis TaxID=59861 RepID=UPI001BE02206|nr:CMRF35-like molecule 3 [Coregonus clupeaformis]